MLQIHTLQRKNPQPTCGIKHLISATHLPTLQRNIPLAATHLPMLQIKFHLRQHTCPQNEKGNLPSICEFKVVSSNYEKHSVYSLAKVVLSP